MCLQFSLPGRLLLLQIHALPRGLQSNSLANLSKTADYRANVHTHTHTQHFHIVSSFGFFQRGFHLFIIFLLCLTLPLDGRGQQTTILGPSPAPHFFLRKVLEHSYTHLFMYCLWLLSDGPLKPKMLIFLALKKGLLTLVNMLSEKHRFLFILLSSLSLKSQSHV